ncbi:LacI family DNA-binding transcriptional regulator [Streptomyces sp. NRRL B-24085]|uniref:LacI family DNA-binding transcriptional regulator n=1 Tax=Streptomyces sp. NRRL B-24085 TaxID=1709476 RepID=UPI0006B350BF|nr:LacI family DNA-binding transcriptional regulator [Streptomyces sp. NRRL B-24085]
MPQRSPRPPTGPAAPATIADVARGAGVSKTTASDALRGHGRVSDATRRAVLDAAHRLGYTPNRSARSLRTSVTDTVALHIPEFLTSAEYYMSFVFGVAEQAARSGLNVTLVSAGRLPQADGLILCDPMPDNPVVDELMNAGLPVVTAERYGGDTQPAGVIWSDHETALTELLDHLRTRGARRPAFVASDTTADWALTLQRTYARWCAGHGIRPLLRKAPFGASPEVLRAVVGELLADAPGTDAIVCAADGAAAAVLPEIRSAGRVVGEDLLLASCVDSLAMRTAEPPITAIDLRPRHMGAECVRLLCGILAGEVPDGTARTVAIDVRVRASTSA